MTWLPAGAMDSSLPDSAMDATCAPSAPARPVTVCMVAHLAYGALTGGTQGHIGGVERQVSLMARWLAAHGHRVSVVTWDEGQPDGIDVDGVRVLTLCRREDGIPGLRFWHPRWTALTRALRRADADVYYHNCGEYVTGQVALWCRRRGRKFVLSTASDADCDRRLPVLTTFRERALYRFGLRHADRVIVQTRTQQRMLEQGFGRESIVIPMPCPELEGSTTARAEPFSSRSGRVLWVGRISAVKRPDRFLELADASPHLGFDLVGPTEDSEYSRRMIERARRTPNVTVHGAATREQMAGFYRHAACLICTSDLEGFPNTFLEAWSQGVPVVSTVDPDGLIRSRGLGAAARDVIGMARAIDALLSSPTDWQAASANARRYYLETHTVERVMPRFERLFADMGHEGSRAGRPGRQPRSGPAAWDRGRRTESRPSTEWSAASRA